jgi:hypothetical protein
MTASCAKWREERQFSDASRGGGRIMARSFASDYQDFLASFAHKRPFMPPTTAMLAIWESAAAWKRQFAHQLQPL